MKKFIAALLSLSLTAALVAACSGSAKPTPAPAPSAPAAEKPKDVTLEFWTISLKPTFDNYINGMIKAYQDKNPHVTIRWTDLPMNSVEEKMLASIAANKSPDVVNLNTDKALLMAFKGGLTNIDEFTTAEQRAAYFDKLYQSAQFEGKTYALPWYASGHVMYMNKEIMTKAGLDPAKPAQTWDELAAQGKAIKQKTGLDPFIPQGDMNRLIFDGVQILTPDKSKAAFNTPDGLAAIKWYADLYQSGTVSKDFITKNYNEALNLYMGGQMAFVLTGPQFLTRVKDQSPEIFAKTDVTVYPMGKARVDQLPLMNVVVPLMSKNQQEAVNFSLFLTNDENQLAFAKLTAILPSTKKAAADEFFKATGNGPEEKARAISVATLADGVDRALGVGPKQTEIQNAIKAAFQAAATGDVTPEKALADAEKKVNDILAK